MTDDEFLAVFEGCTLPRSEWTHTAHVRLARLYMLREPFAMALERIRAGIRRYNASVGSTGYHDTITIAFARLIHAALADPAEPFDAFRDRNPDLFDRTLRALHAHYTRDTLTSDAARERFVEPDVAPLPEPTDGRPWAWRRDHECIAR